MKRFSILIICFLLTGMAHAQPWLKNYRPDEKVKLQDVIDEWKKDHQQEDEQDKDMDEDRKEAAGESEEDDVNFQFDRWVAYWRYHTDENGYMVAPVRTMRAWQAYLSAHAGNSHARTTATAIWNFAGPDSSLANGKGLGRIECITFHPTDSNIFWIGSAGGGAWKTVDGGMHWTCITDNTFPVRGVSDITVNPLNTNSIFLCTGDRDAQDNYCFGILHSINGGVTWDTIKGLTWQPTDHVLANAMLINPQDTNTLLLATNQAIYRSVDAGNTWTIMIKGAYKQLTYSYVDTSIIFATGGPSANVYRSTDGGATWLPSTSVSSCPRMALAVTPQNPAIVKAISCTSAFGIEGFYTSYDTGKTFSRIYDADSGCKYNILSFDPKLTSSSCGGQGWYDLCIAINPMDSNSVYIGGVNTWHSSDGGYSWHIANQWTNNISTLEVVHADKHFMAYNPLAPHTLYETNDGGIYKTLPDTSYWQDLTNGLGITQFYRIAVADNADYVLGGAQDNDTKIVRATNKNDEVRTSGDGMDCAIDYTNDSVYYTAIQYGNITRHVGTITTNISKNISSPAPSGAWTTPYLIDPVNPSVLYAGYDKLYRSEDMGDTWAAYAKSFGGNIDRIAVSAVSTDYIYVLQGNLIYYTTDAGTTWKSLNNYYGNISDIAIDPVNPEHIWATFANYSGTHVMDRLIKDATWTNESGTLPQVPVHSIVIDKVDGTKYIGTDVAVFYRDSTMADWALYNNNLPVVEINDLGINYATGELWAGTYGRGMWNVAKAPPPTAGISVIPFADDVITVSPNPGHGKVHVVTGNSQLLNKTVECSIINMAGKTVWHGNASFSASGSMDVDMGKPAASPYIFQVATGNAMARKRIIILP